MKNVIARAVASFEAYVSASLKIKLDIPSDVEIEADPLAIELLIFNLLKNAAEAVEPLGAEGTVSVSLRLSGSKRTAPALASELSLPLQKNTAASFPLSKKNRKVCKLQWLLTLSNHPDFREITD